MSSSSPEPKLHPAPSSSSPSPSSPSPQSPPSSASPSSQPPSSPSSPLSDIFFHSSTTSEIHSDIPHLQNIHHTAGYRDGISSSKTAFLQRGFDEGYSLGAELGMRVGFILGGLEGLVSAEEKGKEEDRGGMRNLLREARRELAIENVFGREWWDGDGVWKFDVEEEEERGEVTFRMVAERHPLVRRWGERVRGEMRRRGVWEGRFEGEEWERGRVGVEREGEGE